MTEKHELRADHFYLDLEPHRLFEVTQEIEMRGPGSVIAVYTPGMRYRCATAAMSANLDDWIAKGLARVISATPQAAGDAEIRGRGEVR